MEGELRTFHDVKVLKESKNRKNSEKRQKKRQ